jgi:hypothetical protein
MKIEVRGYLSRLVGGDLFPQRSFQGDTVVAEGRGMVVVNDTFLVRNFAVASTDNHSSRPSRGQSIWKMRVVNPHSIMNRSNLFRDLSDDDLPLKISATAS